MDKILRLSKESYAHYKMANFRDAFKLMHQSILLLQTNRLPLDSNQFNLLFDALEMLEVQMQQSSIIRSSNFSTNTLNVFSDMLNRKIQTTLGRLQQLKNDVAILLQAVYVAYDFCQNNQVDVSLASPILQFSVEEGGHIVLHCCNQMPQTLALLPIFNACFEQRLTEQGPNWEKIESLKATKDYAKGICILKTYFQLSNGNQKRLFLELAELYYLQKDYKNAVDAYMKSVVFGTPKAVVAEQIRFCCNHNARYAENPREAARWRRLIIDYFSQ